MMMETVGGLGEAQRSEGAVHRLSRTRVGVPVLTVAVVAFIGLPLLALQAKALSSGAQGYRDLTRTSAIFDVVKTTVVLGVGSVVVAMIVGTGLAWCVYSLGSRWRVLTLLPVLPIIIPPVAAVTGWAFLLSPAVGYANSALRVLPWWNDLQRGPIDVYTTPWIVLLTGFILVSFVYVFMLGGLRSMDPTLISAARACGSRPRRVLFTVVIPILRPQMLYAATIVLLLGLGQFTAPLLLGRQNQVRVLTTEMYSASQVTPINYELAAAFGSPLVVVGVLLVIVQKRLIGNSDRFVTSQTPSSPTQLSGGGVAVLVVLAYFFISVVLPLSALLIVSFSKYWSGTIQWSDFSLDSYRNVLNNANSRRSIRLGTILSLGTAILALPLCYMIATALTGLTDRYSRFRRVLDVMTNMPLTMPGIVFGAGVFFAFTQRPISLYGSSILFVVAYVIIVIPHITRILLGRYATLGRVYFEASRVSGAAPLRAHLTVMLPLMRGACAAAAAVGVALLSHEFSASLMVRTAGTQVMGTALYDYWSGGLYPNVAAMAIIMVLVSALGVLLAWSFGGRKAVTDG